MLTAEVCGLPGIQTTCKAFIVHSFFWDDKQLVTNTAFTKWMCSRKLHVHWLSLSPVSLDEWGADPPGDIQPCLAAEGSTTGYSTSIGAVCQTGKEQDSKTQHKSDKSLTCDVKIVVSKRVSLGLGTWPIRFTRRRAYEPITAVWKQKEDNSWRDREKRCQAEMCHCNGRASNWTTNRVQSALIEIEHCEYLVQDSWSDKPFTILEQREVH